MSYFGKSNFYLEVAKGNVTGHSAIHKFGYNPDIDSGTTADIWELGAVGGNLEYDFASSAETMYLSSSDNADSGAAYTVSIEGLDENWAFQAVENVQLNGQTPVEVGSSTTWIRVFRMYSTGSSATAGNVYAANTSTGTLGNSGVPTSLATVKAYFTISGQQTQQAIYTVPANTTGYMVSWWTSIVGSVGVSQNITAELHIRQVGSIFRSQQLVELNSSSGGWMHHWDIPKVCPAQCDILVHVHDASTVAIKVSAGFDLVLVDD